jgi:lipoprotein-anchoring transpeptidase ErfK/SrfK
MKMTQNLLLCWQLLAAPALLLAALASPLQGEEISPAPDLPALQSDQSSPDAEELSSRIEVKAPGKAVIVVEAEAVDEKDLAAARARVERANVVAPNVRLQIYLDEKRFGPGFIDGKPGKFTTNAVHSYNRSMGRRPDDWEALRKEADQMLGQTYAIAIVPDSASEWVNPELPLEYAEQAEEERMSYRSYLEFMAERYHTSESFLVTLNGVAVANGVAPRKALKVPNVSPFLIESLKEGRSHGKDLNLSARTVVIDTIGRTLFIYEAGSSPVAPGAAVVVAEKNENFKPQKLIAMFPITPGKLEQTHHGEWAIANCLELPSWYYDKQLLDTGIRSKDRTKVLQIPPGPNLPVGILWSGLTKSGIGIHGTASPRTIGRSLSAGCIRLANWDAMRFPTMIRPGAKVVVR